MSWCGKKQLYGAWLWCKNNAVHISVSKQRCGCIQVWTAEDTGTR